MTAPIALRLEVAHLRRELRAGRPIVAERRERFDRMLAAVQAALAGQALRFEVSADAEAAFADMVISLSETASAQHLVTLFNDALERAVRPASKAAGEGR